MDEVLTSLDGYEREIFPAVTLYVGTWLQSNWWIPPLVVIGIVVALPAIARLRPDGRYAHWLPGRFGRISLFCDSQALQIEAGVPYPTAVRLAADISRRRGLVAFGTPIGRGRPERCDGKGVGGERGAWGWKKGIVATFDRWLPADGRLAGNAVIRLGRADG